MCNCSSSSSPSTQICKMRFVERESLFLGFSLLSSVQPSLLTSHGEVERTGSGGGWTTAGDARRHHGPRRRLGRKGSEEESEGYQFLSSP
jgi:hypothetical protein